ncbi:hypothetical protein VaNZ11_000758 [Volvox africanus]|uniref:procollagen-proline 3-dioxygenase n=1 Tax=Volvox africanus TaxID=51714 RepID=A0ABQ5RPD8_9CHLO|nr:hypothetical protein VaNZ11_000758 [Volvox africanus]
MEPSLTLRLGAERCKKRQRTDSNPTSPSPKFNSTINLKIEAAENDKESHHDCTEVNAAQFAEAGHPHPRLAQLPAVRTVLDEVLPSELCQELLFVLRATGTIGYRPHVRSATIHDVSTTAPWLLPPLIRARHAVLSAVEAAFGLSLELAVEFSGLMGWARGAALGWHHDSNREYLCRRHLSAVLYLNTQGEDFGAGDFRFQNGPGPLRVAPRMGRLVAYTADRRNVHCVEEVAWGERCTLTCWFSLEPSASEDPQVVQRLCCNAEICGRSPEEVPPGFGLGSQSLPPPSSSTPAYTAIVQQPGDSESLAPEIGLKPGRAGAFSAPVLPRCWWRRYLGPGLPPSMYQLPAGPGEGPVRGGGGVVGEQFGDVGFSEDGGMTKCDADWKGGAAAEGGSGGAAGGRGVVAVEECGGIGREGDLRLERLRQLGLVVVARAGGMRSGGRDGLGAAPGVRRKHQQSLGTTGPPCANKIGSVESEGTVTKESPRAVRPWGTGGGSPAEVTVAAAAVRPGDAAYDFTSGQAQIARSQTHGTAVSGTPAADLLGNAGVYGSCNDGGCRGGPGESPAGGQESRDVKMEEVEDEEEDVSQGEEAISGEDVWLGLADEHSGIESTRRSEGNEADDAAVITPMPARELTAPSLVWFPSPSAALLAAQFAAYMWNIQRFRSLVQVEEAVRELPAYAHRRMAELLRELPTWKILGSMLSGG